ncbi:MAG: hypothetical protein JSU79_01065 [Dehalococcoidales bacterium]|nr:MAG: hypothetical protein JSU79_01065 [Dehalococcoidales bacterium]
MARVLATKTVRREVNLMWVIAVVIVALAVGTVLGRVTLNTASIDTSVVPADSTAIVEPLTVSQSDLLVGPDGREYILTDGIPLNPDGSVYVPMPVEPAIVSQSSILVGPDGLKYILTDGIALNPDGSIYVPMPVDTSVVPADSTAIAAPATVSQSGILVGPDGREYFLIDGIPLNPDGTPYVPMPTE